MRIALVQYKPIPGDISGNLRRHLSFAGKAIASGAELVMFPELSLTGYEPSLAKKLALDVDDSRFEAIQSVCENGTVAIGVGVPTRHDDGARISVLLFRPGSSRHVHSKTFLHSDEKPYFICCPRPAGLLIADQGIALAICYELSVAAHVKHAAEQRAKIYLASVAKTSKGVEQASKRLSEIARRYSMTTLMVNAVGMADGVLCAGTSSAWNNKGVLLGNLESTEEGIILVDTESNDVALFHCPE